MDIHTILYWKSAVVLSATAVSLMGWRLLGEQRYKQMARPGSYTLLLGLQRLGLFIAAFAVVGADIPSPPADDYAVFGKAVLSGQVPLRDFDTLYGLCFHYFCAVCLLFWDHPLAIMIVLLLSEAAAAWMFLRVAGRIYSPVTIGKGAWLYLWNPCPILFIVLGGSNDTLVMLMAAVTFWALARGWVAFASFWAAFAPFLSKATSLWLVVPVTAGRRHRVKALAVYAMTTGLFLLPFLWIQVPFQKWAFNPTLHHWSTENVWFLLSLVMPLPLPGPFRFAPAALTAAAIIGCWIWLARQGSPGLRSLLTGWIFCMMLSLLLFNRSSPNHMLPAVLPICFLVADFKRRWLFWTWVTGSAALAIETHLRFVWMGGSDPAPAFSTWLAQLAAEGTLWKGWFFGAVVAALLLTYLSIGWIACKSFCERRS